MLSGSEVFADIPGGQPYSQPLAPGSTQDHSDTQAPKRIISRRIDSFSCRFDNSCAICPGDDALSGGRYQLGLERIEGGKVKMTIKGSSRFCSSLNIETEVPLNSLERLQEIIEQQNLASINGWYRSNSALGCSFSLNVVYDSKEAIQIGGDGGISVMPRGLSSYPYLKLFKELAEASGYDFKTGKRKS